MAPRPLRAVLAAAALALGSGCAVGYVAVRPKPGPEAAGARPDWSGLRFTVSGEPGDRFVAARVLRERYGALVADDARDGAFVVEVARAKPRASGGALFFLSFFTFAAVPGYVREDRDLTLTVVAPGGERVSATDRISEHMVSWLPFLLFGPTILASINGGVDGAAMDRVAAAEEVVGRLLASAEPFVARARTAPERSP